MNREKELDFIKNLDIPQDSTFIDVGANLGIYVNEVILYHKRINIIAFEPNAHVYKRLLRLFKYEVNVKCEGQALGNSIGNTKFMVPFLNGKSMGSRGAITLTARKDILVNGAKKFNEFNVKVNKLDDYLKQNDILKNKVSLIKIDVEGHEFNVLKGAKETLSLSDIILIIEIESKFTVYKTDELYMFLSELGFKCYVFHNEILHLLKFDEFMHVSQSGLYKKSFNNNFIFKKSIR
jgi:FkbM family methyltransferase